MTDGKLNFFFSLSQSFLCRRLFLSKKKKVVEDEEEEQTEEASIEFCLQNVLAIIIIVHVSIINSDGSATIIALLSIASLTMPMARDSYSR